jgi:hypothetical protein
MARGTRKGGEGSEYELFKDLAKMVDKATAQSGSAVFVTNHTADWTEEECRCLYDADVDWDDYLNHIKCLIAKDRSKKEVANKEVSDKKGSSIR